MKNRDDELNEEIDSYLDLVTREKIRNGMSPEEARRQATLEMEGTDHVKEAVRDVRRGAWLDQILRDIRFGIRTLRRTPAFTTFTVLTFALTIGGLTTIFSLVNAMLLRPLPYPESDRLVTLMEASRNQPANIGYNVAAPNYLDWEAQATSFSGMALYEYLGFNLAGDGEPEQVAGLRATHKLFDVLGVPPLLGRGFVAEDDAWGNGKVAVISYGLWQRRFAGDSAVIGRNIRINQEPWQIVGVMPKGFAFPSNTQSVWVPIGLNEEDRSRGSHSFFVVARLKPGVTYEQSLTEIRALGDRLAATYVENTSETATAMLIRDQWMTKARSTLKALLAAVILLVLIAAANVASLLVARGHGRRRELAARMALGGSRGRIVSQILTESLLLSVAGSVAGLGIALVAIKGLVSVLPGSLRYLPFRDLSEVPLDFRVFAVTAIVALLAGVIAGLAPALTVLPSDPGEVLRDSEGRGATARRGRTLKNALVSLEVGLAVVVLASAALLITSIRKVLSVEPGVRADNVIAMAMSLPQPDFYGAPIRKTFCAQEAAEVGSVPGVEATSAVSHLPLTGANASRSFIIEGAPDPGTTPPWAQYGVACPGYFATMGIPLRGRDFTLADRDGGELVVIINEALRERYFKNEDPIGKRFRLGRYDVPSPWRTIIGVAGNVRHNGLDENIEAYFYAPYQQAAWPTMSIVTRMREGTAPVAQPIRQALSRFEPEAPVNDAELMSQVVNDSLGHRRFPLMLFTIFAALAVALAATGIFGIASQTVQQRRRELGIRRALGARSQQLYGMVVSQAMLPVLIGVGLGLAGAFAGTRVLRSMLYEVTPTNLSVFGIVAVALCLVAIVACLAPARRAAHVDPASVLRED